ncbi:MAG: hypothetical protein KAJ42_02895 [Gemmatimonadetes bacterium]|nr:hypothetical protein [Gemmatimonadota bacterium]
MKIALEGTAEEVGGMLRALAGGVVDNALMFEAFQQTHQGQGVPMAKMVEAPSVFVELVKGWAENFDMTGKRHWGESSSTEPDPRAEAMRAIGISSQNGKVLQWVAEKGGLTHAVHEFVEDKQMARAVATNIAQVASILFPDLTDLLEHFDPFEEK